MSRFDGTDQKMSIIIFQIMEEAWNLDLFGIYLIVEVTCLVCWATVTSAEMTMVCAFDLRLIETLNKNKINMKDSLHNLT